MKKAMALLFIAMIEAAATMPFVMACGSYKCPPSPTIPKPPWIPKPPYGGSPPVIPKDKCPLNALKLGACVDVLGGLVHVGLGDPVVNKCCPVVQGVAALEAALCLCTTIKAKVLNLNILLPLALELLVSCGLTPPKGFKCPTT
uniref:Bifunctional inhibitor/plant lipid transfer protein/seed storage helical domain-containing protein n=1 Tax=Araucaria cunninghamii TaxID=56994 RepID=A0A0D6R162_ARACU